MSAPHLAAADTALRVRYTRALELIESLMDQTDTLTGKVAYLEGSREKDQVSKAALDEANRRIAELERATGALGGKTVAQFREEQERAVQRAQNETNALRTELLERRQELEEVKVALSKAQTEAQRLKKDTAASREQMRHLTEERRRLQTVVGTLNTVENEKKHMEAELKQAQGELRRIHREQGSAAQAQQQQLNKQLEEMLATERARMDDMARALQATQQERDNVVSDARQMQAFIEQLQNKIHELQQRGAGATFAKFVNLKSDNEKLADKVSKLKNMVSMKDVVAQRRKKRAAGLGGAPSMQSMGKAVMAFGSGRSFGGPPPAPPAHNGGAGGGGNGAAAGGFAQAVAARRRGSGHGSTFSQAMGGGTPYQQQQAASQHRHSSSGRLSARGGGATSQMGIGGVAMGGGGAHSMPVLAPGGVRVRRG